MKDQRTVIQLKVTLGLISRHSKGHLSALKNKPSYSDDTFLGQTYLGLNPDSVTHLLYELGQVNRLY